MYFIQKEQLQQSNLAGNLEDHVSALHFLLNQEKSKMISIWSEENRKGSIYVTGLLLVCSSLKT